MRRFDPGYSFRSSDFQGRRSEEEGRECARGEWCSGRVVTFVDGERVVRPARGPRAFCDLCQQYLARCAAEVPAFWLRLSYMTGDPLQAEIPVRTPFGPQVPLREDIDAHLRLTAVLLGGWAARVRAVPGLSLSAPEHAHDSAAGVRDNARVLARHASVLLALPPGWMTRSFPLARDDEPVAGRDWLPDATLQAPKPRSEPVPADVAEAHADAEIIRAGVDFVHLPVLADGEDAGRELQWVHYRARSLLLETNPPPELLIPPCRQCTWRALRRAWADGEHDLFSRCDHCLDEMTAEEYDVNAKRWVAYHKYQATPAQVAAGMVA